MNIETGPKPMTSPFDMTGHTVWITGSGSGIGQATARLFAQSGADVVVHGFNQMEACATLCDEIRGLGRRSIALDGDLTLEKNTSAMAAEIEAELGGLSVLVNCAGGSPRKSKIADMPAEDFDFVIRTNLHTQFLAVQAALPMLERADKASIVNYSSAVTRNGGVPGGTSYATSKGGVEGFTRALARELAPLGIRVNAVAPGLVDSPFHPFDAREKYAHIVDRIPLGRIGNPIDLAAPTLFLASDAAAYITGELIEVSGGTRLVS